MPNLTLTNEQVIELVKQLEREQQLEILNFLLLQEWGEWESLSRYGAEKVRKAAMKGGYNWDLMNEAQREELIDEIVHEQ